MTWSAEKERVWGIVHIADEQYRTVPIDSHAGIGIIGVESEMTRWRPGVYCCVRRAAGNTDMRLAESPAGFCRSKRFKRL